MFSEFNMEVFGFFAIFAVVTQLLLEVMVFGWEREERYVNLSNWLVFANSTKRRRFWNGFFDITLACVWAFGMYKHTLETFAALLVALVAFAISMYFTLYDRNGNRVDPTA